MKSQVKKLFRMVKVVLIIVVILLSLVLFPLSILSELKPILYRRLLESLNILWLDDIVFIAGILLLFAYAVFIIVYTVRKRNKKEEV